MMTPREATPTPPSDESSPEPVDFDQMPTTHETSSPTVSLRSGITPGTVLMLVVLIVAGEGWVVQTYVVGGNVVTGALTGTGILVVGIAALWWVRAFQWLRSHPHGRKRSKKSKVSATPGSRDSKPSASDMQADYRRVATVRINELIEELIYDYGRLLAGYQPDLEYVSPQVATMMAQAVAPIRRSGARIKPNFGSYVDVDIDWSSSDVHRPVTATATFVDTSTRIGEGGLGVQMPRRNVHFTVAFDHSFSRIIDASIEP